MSDAISSLPPGCQLITGKHNYRIDSLLGAGAFGNAYLCTNMRAFMPYQELQNSPLKNFVVSDQDMGGRENRLVIKELFPKKYVHRGIANDAHAVVPNSGATCAEEWRRQQSFFIAEARTLWKLSLANNRNIVRVYHMGIMPNGITFFVMPYVGNCNLASRIGLLTREELCNYLRKLLVAVDDVHYCGILHRDIKPQNIILDVSGEPVLIDFGMACPNDVSGGGLNGGTPGYMPWEQLSSGQRMGGKPGPWSDIYALGASFYQLITGRKVPEHNLRSPSAAVNGDPYIPLVSDPACVAKYGRGILESIDRALCIDPARRWQSAWEWLQSGVIPEWGAGAPPRPLRERLSVAGNVVPPPLQQEAGERNPGGGPSDEERRRREEEERQRIMESERRCWEEAEARKKNRRMWCDRLLIALSCSLLAVIIYVIFAL